MIDDDMRDLIEFFGGPRSQMIPGARLPVIDHLGRWEPGWQVQQQVIRQSIDKRLVHPSYVSEVLLSILFMSQLEPHISESSAHPHKISRWKTIKLGIHRWRSIDLSQVNCCMTRNREGEAGSRYCNPLKANNE